MTDINNKPVLRKLNLNEIKLLIAIISYRTINVKNTEWKPDEPMEVEVTSEQIEIFAIARVILGWQDEIEVTDGKTTLPVSIGKVIQEISR